MWVQLPFKSDSPRLTRQEHKITREWNPQHWLTVLTTSLRKETLTAKASRYPRESLWGRRDTLGGKGNHKGRALGTWGTDGPGHSPPSLFVQENAELCSLISKPRDSEHHREYIKPFSCFTKNNGLPSITGPRKWQGFWFNLKALLSWLSPNY